MLLIRTRLLAEQARASDDTGGVVDGMNYNGTSSAAVRPAILDASLAFMYVEKERARSGKGSEDTMNVLIRVGRSNGGC